jgi:hypothetical protein
MVPDRGVLFRLTTTGLLVDLTGGQKLGSNYIGGENTTGWNMHPGGPSVPGGFNAWFRKLSTSIFPPS